MFEKFIYFVFFVGLVDDICSNVIIGCVGYFYVFIEMYKGIRNGWFYFRKLYCIDKNNILVCY